MLRIRARAGPTDPFAQSNPSDTLCIGSPSTRTCRRMPPSSSRTLQPLAVEERTEERKEAAQASW